MTPPLILPAKLDLAAASPLMVDLRDRTEASVVVDMSEVRYLGALCLQVLLSAATTARSEDRKLTLVNVSDLVVDQLRVMGMNPESVSRGRQ
jgi:chemotaxis protein CheX